MPKNKEISPNKLLIFDGNSLLNRAYFALPPLNDQTGKNVNAVFGFVKLMNKAIEEFSPTHMVVTFDMRGENFRKKIYNQYKANRHGMPDDLAEQLPVLKDLLTKMQVWYIEQPGVEADDIIGTIVTNVDADCLIVSGDKDLLQLVNDHTMVVLTKRGISETEKVTPEVLSQNYSLTPSQVVDYKALRGDASDNIPGVMGIGEKTATALLNEFGDLDNIYKNIDSIKGAVKEKLLQNKQMAYISRQLATIVTDLQIKSDISCFNLPVYNQQVKDQFVSLKFLSLLKDRQFEPVAKTPKVEVQTEVIFSLSDLKKILTEMCQSEVVSLHFENDIFWFANNDKKQYSVAISDNFLSELNCNVLFDALKGLLEGQTPKVVFDSKWLRHGMAPHGVELKNACFDISLMQYLTEQNSYKKLSDILEIYGFSGVACGLFSLNNLLTKKLNDMHLKSIYDDIELPLSDLLFRMEQQGITVDMEVLNSLSQLFKQKINHLSQQIFDMAGEEFNISSPKQLSTILFEKLGLKHFKKTTTGYSTNNEVLEKLKSAHPIIDKIIEYRSYTKLMGTYVSGMLPLIKANKIHTTYNQFLTTTGRLSSSEPNLQNIPIRDQLGREIRKMFVSKYGKFVSADYSQIELRLLAGFSGDENLLASFRAGEDIHKKVASEIFSVPLEMVNSQMRRAAKTVNFGIVYGQSAFSLAENLGISFGTAKQYIDKFFHRFPKIKTYLDGLIEQAKAEGFVTTFIGRRRYIPEILSSNFQLRGFGERAAMNMPLQGSAADIMKIAMLKVDERIRQNNLKSKILLQIHDELVVDCFEEEVQQIVDILTTQMQTAVEFPCPLSVEVEVGKNLFEV